MGQRTGMSYNYLKVILMELKPQEESLAHLRQLSRQSDQQAEVFKREFRSNFNDLREDTRNIIPEDIVKNPFEKFMIRSDEPVEMEGGRNSIM